MAMQIQCDSTKVDLVSSYDIQYGQKHFGRSPAEGGTVR